MLIASFSFNSASSYFMPFFHLIVAKTCAQLNPRSQEYFRRTRELMFSSKLEDICPQSKRSEAIAAAKSKLDGLDDTLRKNGEGKLFVMGNTPTFLDILLASYFCFFRLLALEEEWSQVASWHGARWAKLLEILQPYEEGRGDDMEAWTPE